MKTVLVQLHKEAVMTSIDVFDEKDVDGMLTAVTTLDARIFAVADELCVDGNTLCEHVAVMAAQNRFITPDNINPTM